METPTGTFEKLVRDRIPAIVAAEGTPVRVRTVPVTERMPWLLAKLEEEALEVREGPVLEEVADVLEVLHALAAQLGARWEDVEAVRAAKARARGGFADGLVMTFPT